MIKRELEISKKGIKSLWERGGAYSNTGEAEIIANFCGEPKRAIFIKTHGERCCGNHALIPVVVNDVIVHAEWNRHRDGDYYKIYRIKKIDSTDAWIEEIDAEDVYMDVIEAALRKAAWYHCKEPIYISKY